MISLPDSGWVRALLDLKPAGALVVALGLGALAGLGLVPEWARPLLLVAAVVCLAPPANWLAECLSAWRRARRVEERQREVLAHLDDLGLEETRVLAGCLLRNEPAFSIYLDNWTAISLRQKGLAKALSSGNLDHFPHVIPDFVWRELKRRSHEIIGVAEAAQELESARR